MNPLSYYDPNDPYPESDGQPMAENTEQYDWLVKIKENLEILFADRDDVFIAGDLLWYPVPDREISGPLAPDVMVAFGRPKGQRGSYRQWEEAGIAPQVVFEVVSPSNSRMEMKNKWHFYDQYGVEEYYVYDPKRHHLEIWLRQREHLKRILHLNGWISPRLGIRFVLKPDFLEIYHPDGRPFLNSVALARLEKAAEERAEQQAARAEREAARAQQEARYAAEERLRAERFAERLRALGVDPNDLEG
jgi:Uma2 family endonuclease